MSTKKINFEKSMADLEQLVEQMESGDLSLEASLKAFEKGVQLTRDCQKALETAEQKVNLLIEEHGISTEVPFDDDEEDEF